jgi:hypothetical protein
MEQSPSLKANISPAFRVVPLLYAVLGGVVVEALRYKPKGRGFDSRWCHWIFSLT